MRLLVLGICSIVVFCSCNDGIFHESQPTTLSVSNSCSDESSCSTYASEQQLESVLEKIKLHAEYPITSTIVERVDNQYVLTDQSTSAGKAYYEYFIKVVDDVLIIDKIIGRSSLYGITRRFAVINVNIPLDESYREVADDLLVETKEEFANDEYKDERIGTHYNLPMQETRGKIGNTIFYIRYENEEDFSHFDMQQIVECDGDKRTLKDGLDFFIGYDYSNLETENFILITDELSNHHYYYQMADICETDTLFRD